METNRRSFLLGVLSLTVAASSLTNAAEAALPVLYGDCVHDDTVALQALLDGMPFRTSDGFVGTAVEGQIMKGRFLVSSTLHLRRPSITITECYFRFDHQDVLWHFHSGATDGLTNDCYFDCGPQNSPPLLKNKAWL